jgi:hypothetical protein
MATQQYLIALNGVFIAIYPHQGFASVSLTASSLLFAPIKGFVNTSLALIVFHWR